nr:MAG TPA: hypothetical protein [Caudoviricetes sp.]
MRRKVHIIRRINRILNYVVVEYVDTSNCVSSSEKCIEIYD